MSIETKKKTLAKYTGEKRTPVKAMRAYCLSCCMYSAKEVKLCTVYDCPLYPYRLGENSFSLAEVSQAQKDRARAMGIARAMKTHNRIDSTGESS